ncbi:MULTISPECIES: hypothetical protein [Cryobacterium]|uniref:Uncharacterized protein n=1 Tax=Cryobacterium luteum TaxID=1424661 RepID=A0A5F0DGM8_9MICO|nr:MULTISPECIES: hypothetical protein [Cryobacterium]TFB95516.1 hypothetical protein E3O10_00230 [Cryobacterium luteum]
MVEALKSHRSESDASRAWLIGGALLLATVVIGVAQPALALIPLGGSIRPVLFSAALLVFAFGIRGAGSVTARRPLGTIALTALAAWLLLGSVLQDVIASSFSNDPLSDGLFAFGYVDSFVTFALALVAVMQIARAGVVAAPWNWVPAGVVGAASVSWLLSAVVTVNSRQGFGLEAVVLMSVDALVRIGGTVLLGVVAIVLADRARRVHLSSADEVVRSPYGPAD